jgi:hypothetical protein
MIFPTLDLSNEIDISLSEIEIISSTFKFFTFHQLFRTGHIPAAAHTTWIKLHGVQTRIVRISCCPGDRSGGDLMVAGPECRRRAAAQGRLR